MAKKVTGRSRDKKKTSGHRKWNVTKNTAYKNIKPHVTNKIDKFVSPVAGTDFSTDRFLVFDVTMGPREFGVFKEFPFTLLYRFTAGDPPARVETFKVAQDAMNSATRTVAGDKAKKMFYMNNALGPSSLFSHMEASINGYDLNEKSNLGTMQYLWQGLNRFFSTKAERTEKYGETMASLVDTDAKRDFLHPCPELLENLKSTHFPTDAKFRSEVFGFDGASVFGSRCFAHAKLRGHSATETQNFVLPPGSNLIIKLFFTESFTDRLEFYKDMKNYITNVAAGGDTIESQALHMDIKDLRFAYKSHTIPEPHLLDKFNRGNFKCYSDNICHQQFHTPLNQKHTPFKIEIPAKTKVVFIAFPKTWQLYRYSAADKNQLARYVFPQNLKSVTCTLPGGEVLGFEGGFDNIGDDTFQELGPRAYYQSLIEKRVIDCSYDDLFPEGPFGAQNISFRQAIMLDLTQKNIPEKTSMDLSCIWKPHSEADVSIVVFTVQEMELKRDRTTGRYTSQII